jgi:hypothetical protein
MASGAPKLDFENYKKFYGFGIPKWSPYYHVTEEDDKRNAETIARHKSGVHGLPKFATHEELREHLINMSDTELNRMRDFGCGKPHWSPYYVEPAYTAESIDIPGEKKFAVSRSPRRLGHGSGNPPPPSDRSSARASSRSGEAGDGGGSTSRRSASGGSTARSGSATARKAEAMALGKGSSRATPRNLDSARTRERKGIETQLADKQREIDILRIQLTASKKFA